MLLNGRSTDIAYLNAKYKFTGKELDTETNYYHFAARPYDGRIGLWMQTDPLTKESPGISPYVYANDNPITILDLFGMDTIFVAQLQPVVVSANRYEWQPSNWWQLIGMPANTLLMYPNYYRYRINENWSVERKQIEPIPQTTIGIVPGSITGPESEGIEITGQALQHILESHLQGGLKSAGKSLFTVGKEEIVQLIKNAETVTSAKQIGGNLERVIDAGRKIGIDRASGLPTSTYTVITSQSGKLITAFPGKL